MTVRDLTLRYFDKTLLGASVLWLASAATSLAAAPGDELRADLDASMAALHEHMQGATVAASPPPSWAARLDAHLRAAPAAAPLGPTWVLHRRPAFLYDHAPAAQPPEFVHEAATDVAAEASQPGRVVVRWSPGRTAYVLTTCTVERRRGDDGAWERVAEVPADARELIDETVAPRARYVYRVVSHARADEDDPGVKAAIDAGTFEELAADLARAESAPSAPVETPPELYVVPLSVDVDERDPDAGRAYLLVHRWDRAAKRFVSGRQQAKVGDDVAGLVLHAVGVDGATLWVELRDADGGEVRREDSRRDRLPEGVR